MKTFKSFLTESSMASIDATSMDLEDIIDCYRNAGYEVSRQEMKSYKQEKYAGFNPKNKAHMYWVLWEDDNEEQFCISKFFITLEKDGKLHAESGGMPEHCGTEAEMNKKFQSL